MISYRFCSLCSEYDFVLVLMAKTQNYNNMQTLSIVYFTWPLCPVVQTGSAMFFLCLILILSVSGNLIWCYSTLVKFNQTFTGQGWELYGPDIYCCITESYNLCNKTKHLSTIPKKYFSMASVLPVKTYNCMYFPRMLV